MRTDAEPHLSSAQLEAYLARIGFRVIPVPDVATLDTLIWLHQLAIPFENLDIVRYRRTISLDPDAIFTKLVVDHRGGFCYEQNGLLALALRAIGFMVDLGYGTWLPEGKDAIPPFDHIVLQVHLPNDPTPRLADVGFGQFAPSRSVPLDPAVSETHPETGFSYRATAAPTPDRHWRIQWQTPDLDWSILYDLDFTPRVLSDYEERSRFHQTSGESIFGRGAICSKPIAGGRVSVAKTRLMVTLADSKSETELSDAEMTVALRDWFGIKEMEQRS